MKNVEFCYWLQGYFELRQECVGQDSALTTAQWTCIQNHLNLVKKVEKNKLKDFTAWLDGALDVLQRPELKVDNEAMTQLVRTKLNDTFEHVIDKSYGGDQEELAHIHRPPGMPFRPGSGDGLIRC